MIVNRKTVEDSQLPQVEDAIDAVVIAELDAHHVARDVQDDQPLQIFQLYRLLHVADQIISQIELHQVL